MTDPVQPSVNLQSSPNLQPSAGLQPSVETREQLQAAYALLVGGCNIFLVIMFVFTILIIPILAIGIYLGYITRNSLKYRNLALIGLWVNAIILFLVLILALYNILIINLT